MLCTQSTPLNRKRREKTGVIDDDGYNILNYAGHSNLDEQKMCSPQKYEHSSTTQRECT